jgi:hypothetical protein
MHHTVNHTQILRAMLFPGVELRCQGSSAKIGVAVIYRLFTRPESSVVVFLGLSVSGLFKGGIPQALFQ